MMKNFKIQQAILTTMISVACVGLSNASAQTLTPANTVCKTGSDTDLPEIKSKVANMAEDLKRLKQVKQNSRAGVSVLRSEILTIDQELGPWRARHKLAAEQAGETADTYAVYKANWIDTGELARLNATINLRKTKHQNYKQARAQYSAENTEFKALGTKYQHIARDLLDRDRDCAAAIMALE